MMRLVNPIIKVLGALVRYGCCLYMIYYYFVLTRIRDRIKFRWKSLKCESVLAAFLLDPSKAVDAFEGNDLDDAINKSVDFATRVELPSSSWSLDECENNSCDAPLDWGMLKNKRFPLLYDFATRLQANALGAFTLVLHNKRKNRLKPERVEELAFIYSNTGDKGAKSQVHYMETEEDVDERRIFDRFSDSDIESPVLPEISNATPTSAQNEAAELARSASGITPRARRT
ncbi:hypothetical protein PHMEG_00026983 [Phytophthora megakarya]|uniref:HAT C-terminal dimerisation domain-containing protein n=1 Tax=Phytophthora megakarya TaxID=4795 RepID=A0A225V893_9STRA|nr:hypothetical protein PHMEG_00026983 [Phytophthora megakarya]